MNIYSGRHNLLDFLAAAGLIPPNCIAIDFQKSVEGLSTLSYTINVTPDSMKLLRVAIKKFELAIEKEKKATAHKRKRSSRKAR